MGLRLIKAFAIFAAGSAATFADTPVDEGMLFFEAFASKCASSGPFSSRALEDTKTLESIVRIVKDDENCKGMAGLVDSIVTASAQFSFVHRGTEDQQTRELEDLQRRLSLAYATATDPAEKLLIQTRLAETSVQLIELPTIQEQERKMQRQYAVTNLANYLQQASEQLPAQMNCFENHKTLPVQLALQLLAVSGGFFDPKINLAVSLAGRLFNSFLNFFSNWKLNRRIEDYRKTTMQAGISCAMEALEQTVCDIQDQAKLVDSLIKYRDDDTIPEAWMGYDLFQRDYPVVQDFLRQVEIGSDPKSKDQSDRRAEFNQKETSFKNIRDRMLGLMGDAEDDLALADKDTDDFRRTSKRATIFQNLVNTMALSIAQSGEPYSAVIPGLDRYSAMIIWLRIDTPSPTMPAGVNSLDEFVTYLNSPTSSFHAADAQYSQDLNRIRETFRSITATAEDRINLERTRTINPDKEGALFSWTVSTSTNPSPGVVMDRLADYLAKLQSTWIAHPEWFSSPEEQLTQLNLVISTRSRFIETLTILKGDQPAEQKLNRIYEIMQLRDHDTVMTARIQNLVEQDLLMRLKDGFLRQDSVVLDTAVRLSTKSIYESLTPGTSEARSAALTHIQDDIFRAHSFANANLMYFYKHYGETVVFILNYLRSLAFSFAPRDQKVQGINNFQMPARTPEGVEYSRLCILALNDPNLDDNRELLNLCSGRTLEFKRLSGEVATDSYNQPIEAHFDWMLGMDPMDRLCAYRRYSNRRDLHEILRHRPSPFFRTRP